MNIKRILGSAVLLSGLIAAPFVCRHSYARAGAEASTIQRLNSRILNEERTVRVFLPDSYGATSDRYPLLAVLDGEDLARPMAGMVSYYAKVGKCPELVVAGIDAGDRWRDYTPTKAAIPDGTLLPTSGSAAAFMKFIENECLPYLEAKYRISPFHVLCGHSIAGLFAVNSALDGESDFSGFIATSPSLWWDDESMSAKAKASPGPSRPRHLFLTMGNEGPTMLDPMLDFIHSLEAGPRPGLDWKFRHFEDVDHQAMPIKAFAYGLEFIFADWTPPPDLLEGGLPAVMGYYDRLSARYMQKIAPPESTINRLGYMALSRGALDESLEIFRFNIKLHPLSANAYDSMGEACLKAGDARNALLNYKKALELDPGNDKARKTVKKLEAEQ
jgi:predicted alpha/beta superfamily hydrolase